MDDTKSGDAVLSAKWVAEQKEQALQLDWDEALEMNASTWRPADPFRAPSLGDLQCFVLGVRRGLA